MLGDVWKRWNWLDDGLIPFAGILMTAAWGYPLFVSFMRDPKTGIRNSGFTFWLCVVVLLGGFLAGRLASQNRMGTVIVVIGGMAMILVSLLLTVPSEGRNIDLWFVDLFKFVERGRLTGEVLPVSLVIVVLATILWTRGVRLSGMRHEGGVGAFVVGVVAIAGLLLIAEFLPTDTKDGVQVSSKAMQGVIGGLAPLFLITIPAAVMFSVLAPALGAWANTAGEISIVAGVLFLSLILPFGPTSQSLIGWLLLFLASGLATLALMSVSTTLREQERLTGIHLQVDRYWVAIMLIVVTCVLLLGLIVGQILAPATVLRLFALLRPVWWVVRQILLYVILIFAYLFFSLLEPLLADLQDRPARELTTFVSPVEPVSMEELAREPIEIPPMFATMLQVVLILGFFGVIALIFYLAIRRRDSRTLEPGEVIETRETVLSMDLIQEQIKGLFDSLRRRQKESFFVGLDPLSDPRWAIREMYQKVLAQAIRLDLPRKKHQTPRTYCPTLADLCPEEGSAIETLTQIYAIARYGTELPTPEQVQCAQDAFARINAALQRHQRMDNNAFDGPQVDRGQTT